MTTGANNFVDRHPDDLLQLIPQARLWLVLHIAGRFGSYGRGVAESYDIPVSLTSLLTSPAFPEILEKAVSFDFVVVLLIHSRLITDRFAPSTPNAPCVLNPNVTRYVLSSPSDPSSELKTTYERYCGGTWSSLTSHLDYIQSLGFTAIWISPTSPQINSSLYGEAYHGYWPINHQLLNPHFGTTTDLIALSNEVHKRGMYLMVDIVLNHLASLSTDTTVVKMKSNMAITGQMMFSDPLEFHPPCVIDEMNQTSLERCWFSLRGYKLMDLATETEGVRGKMEEWIKGFVETFQVDGLRLDCGCFRSSFRCFPTTSHPH